MSPLARGLGVGYLIGLVVGAFAGSHGLLDHPSFWVALTVGTVAGILTAEVAARRRAAEVRAARVRPWQPGHIVIDPDDDGGPT